MELWKASTESRIGFILFLKERGSTRRIQHFASAFSKGKPDHPATVQSANVTCIRLY